MKPIHPNAKDLSGQIFGRLTAIRQRERRAIDGGVFWDCICVCGNTVSVRTSSLTGGVTRSCGCFQRESVASRPTIRHGQARDGHVTRTYRIWRGMLSRCAYAGNSHFDRYGGRGISVCERWKDFVLFRSDMGDCPPNQTIERINNDGNYEPANCRWATQKEQTRNMSRNRLMTTNGVTLCVTDWAERLGISKNTIWARLRYGWTDEQILTTPVKRQ